MARRLRGRINPDSRTIHPKDWKWTDRRLHEMDMLNVVFDYLKIGMQVEWTQHGD